MCACMCVCVCCCFATPISSSTASYNDVSPNVDDIDIFMYALLLDDSNNN